MPQLPPLSELPHGISALSPLTCAAQDYEASLPSAGVTAVSGGLRFNASGGGQGLSGLAYAVYSFNLSTLSGSQNLYLLQHDDAFVTAGGMQDLYVGLANFDTGRWVWRRASAEAVDGVFPISTIEHYADDDGSAFVAVMLRGSRDFQLDALSFLRYDEVEPNDTQNSSAGLLPAGDYAGIRGSLGSSQNHPGYDGDTVDFWQLQQGTGEWIGADVYFDTEAAAFELRIIDANGVTVPSTTAVDGRIHIQAKLAPQVGLELTWPLYLRITALSGASEYTLIGHQGAAPIAQFSQDVVNGPPPLAVNFDSALSSDSDGSIVGWYWDMDDPAQTVTLDEQEAQWTFDGEDKPDHRVRLTVVDNEGFTASRLRLIRTGFDDPVTEWEDNDYFSEAQPMPGASGLVTGNVGGAGFGFDGDNDDYFRFQVPAGETLVVLLTNAFDQVGPGGITGTLIGEDVNVTLNPYGAGYGPQVLGAEDSEVFLKLATTDDFPLGYKLNYKIGVAPEAYLTANPPSSGAPYNAVFLATAIDENDDELSYLWDLDQDGDFETDTGADDSILVTVLNPGAVVVKVRVINDAGIYVEATAVAVGF